VGTRGEPPYRSVLTHGFTVDGSGRKMSKSVGNYLTQEELLPRFGADVLRLWVAAEDYTEDIRLSDEILNRLSDAYRRIRNTWRFLLGTLADFEPERDRVSYDQMDELDRWALLRLGELITRVRRAYEDMGVMEFADTDAAAILENDNRVAEEFDAKQFVGQQLGQGA